MFASYRETWRRRWAAERRAETEAAEAARRALPCLVDLLVRLGATRVVLFGSLARGRFGPGSDIDLAVEGIADELGAAVEAQRMTLLPVDVVPLEHAFPHIRERVASEGEVLHDAHR